MSIPLQELIQGYFDDLLTPEQESELNLRLRESPADVALFAEWTRMHNGLRDLIGKPAEPRKQSTVGLIAPTSLRRRIIYVAGLAAIAAAVFVFFGWGNPTPLSAAAELNRLIESDRPSTDRIYRITSLDPSPAPIEPRQAPIDGATLYVRTPDRYVLSRRFEDGRVYVTGFDGERNWSAGPEGAVRLSRDPLRFRWPLPGHQYGIPMADLRSDLVQLRDAYELTFLPTEGKLRRLEARKKSRDFPGPRRVEICYDPETGVIHKMVFDGLPRNRGGPGSVAVELQEQRDLGTDFYDHTKHHGPERRVIEED